MSKDIPSSYTQEVKRTGNVLVRYSTLAPTILEAGKASYEEQLGYSIIHLTAKGNHTTSLANCEWVAMPHVIARGNDKAVAAQMKQAGFTKEGLCKGRNTVEERQKEAVRLGAKLWSMFGTPAPEKKAKVQKAAVKVEAPAVEEAPAAE